MDPQNVCFLFLNTNELYFIAVFSVKKQKICSHTPNITEAALSII